MPIFDRYIAVDWSANNGPKTGRDSIWIGEASVAGLASSRNPSTRAAVMADIEATLLAARSRGERIMLGFDFVFGFPVGAASSFAHAVLKRAPASTSTLAGEVGRGEGEPQPWQQIWSTLSTLIEDTDQNLSNRFDVAEILNRVGAQFWGHPHGRHYADLTPKRTHDYARIAERRVVEGRLRGPQPVWKLTGVGAVGSQTLLGIPRLEALRHHAVLGPEIAVWPFDTDFERNLSAPVTLVEIYPSLFPLQSVAMPKDRAQVETCVSRYAALDAAGLLGAFLSAPVGLGAADRAIAIAEEGWIAGVGHDALWQSQKAAA